MPRARTPTIVIVSDGRGVTARRVVDAAAVQFEGRRYRVLHKSEVLTVRDVQDAVREAKKRNAVIFYTLVAETTRRAIRTAAARSLVPTVDVLGPAFTALHDVFRSRTRGATPGLMYERERERAERMAAIEYTLKHDDGQRPHELGRADVVLVGVSRASKSSTCFYLANLGIKAANVPLIPGVAPPQHLLRLPADKVVGLRINVSRLLAVREARAGHLGIEIGDPYLDRRTIAREVLHADLLMDEHGWRSLDVSYLAIEEIAGEVMSLLGLSKRRW